MAIGLFNPFLDISSVLRQQCQDMTLVQASILCAIWEDPRASQGQLAQRVGVREATVSRAVGLLSKHGNRSTSGLCLIEINNDPNDRRQRFYTFSPKGKSVMETIEKLLGAYRGRPQES